MEDAGELDRVLVEVETDATENRLNDCRCDPGGRVWAGTMSKVRRVETLPSTACGRTAGWTR